MGAYLNLCKVDCHKFCAKVSRLVCTYVYLINIDLCNQLMLFNHISYWLVQGMELVNVWLKFVNEYV